MRPIYGPGFRPCLGLNVDTLVFIPLVIFTGITCGGGYLHTSHPIDSTLRLRSRLPLTISTFRKRIRPFLVERSDVLSRAGGAGHAIHNNGLRYHFPPFACGLLQPQMNLAGQIYAIHRVCATSGVRARRGSTTRTHTEYYRPHATPKARRTIDSPPLRTAASRLTRGSS